MAVNISKNRAPSSCTTWAYEEKEGGDDVAVVCTPTYTDAGDVRKRETIFVNFPLAKVSKIRSLSLT